MLSTIQFSLFAVRLLATRRLFNNRGMLHEYFYVLLMACIFWKLPFSTCAAFTLLKLQDALLAGKSNPLRLLRTAPIIYLIHTLNRKNFVRPHYGWTAFWEKWKLWDLNPGPDDYEAVALTAELSFLRYRIIWPPWQTIRHCCSSWPPTATKVFWNAFRFQKRVL